MRKKINLAGNELNRSYRGIKMKIRMLISLLLITMVLPSSVLGCNSGTGEEREDDMNTKPSIPTIDIYAPAHTETATFGLG